MSTNPTTSSPQPAIMVADETVATSSLKKPVASVKLTQRDLIDQGIAALFDGGVVEMRIPEAGRFRVISGYFDDYKKLADEIEQWSGVNDIAGVYYCINPVNPALLARAANRAKAYAKLTTKDEDIACRRWLLIDCDPNRPAGISSTDSEKQLAFEKGKAIRAYLRESGWPEPLVADSANGFHLLYRVDLPNDKDAGVLVQNCLNALSEQFSDKDNHNGVKVDTTVGNAARIVKAYGSLGAKGDSIIDRPHRFSRLLRTELAGGKEVVSTEKLRELAAQASTSNPPTPTNKTDYYGPKVTPERVEEFLEFYGVEHREQVREAGRTKWTLLECPFNPDHRNKDAAVFLTDGSGLGFKCFHDHCANCHWHEFRAEVQKRYPTKFFSFSESKREVGNEKDLTQFRHTDSGNAERLIAKYGEDFRYLHDSKRWLHWDGTRWNPDQTAEIHRAAKETVHIMHQDASRIKDETMRQKYAVWVARSESRGTRENMVALAQSERKVSALGAYFDTNPMLLNVLNGTLDLETFELREHRREDLLTKLCPVSFDPTAECPRWLSFLQEIFPGQPEVIEFLQRSVGYSLTGDTEEQCFWLLIGVGKNGKSKFMDAIQFLLGDYAVATSFDTFAAKKDSAAINPRDGMASLAGSRFVRASESDEGRRFSEAQLKALTGGERIRTARMYQEDFDFKPTFKIWLSTNNEPQIHGTDEGIWRRINRVNFGVVIPEEKRDRQLGAKLQAEVSGILNWALAGLKQYRSTGLKLPQMVIQATAQYREGQNLVGRFLDEKTEKVSDTFTFSATELYTSFKNWARDNGEAVLTRTKSGKEAKKLLSDKRDSTGRVAYIGIRIRQEETVNPVVEQLDAAAIPF